MDRETAWQILCEYTQTEGLRKHGLSVETVMRYFARKHGEDEDVWGVTGLLHDFDYECWPTMEGHPFEGNKILAERGCPEEIRTAIMGHADYTGVARETLMAKTLFAADELTGFVTAVALVRPNKSVFEVEPASVRKKMKDKAFARQVNRDDIVNGAPDRAFDCVSRKIANNNQSTQCSLARRFAGKASHATGVDQARRCPASVRLSPSATLRSPDAQVSYGDSSTGGRL